MIFRKHVQGADARGAVKRVALGFCALALAGSPLLIGPGCNSTLTDDDPADPLRTTSQGMNVMTVSSAGSDAEAFNFKVDRVSCSDGSVLEADVKDVDVGLEDMTLPGGNPTFENKPYDEDSEHVFGDQYFVLDAGCYDVEVTPLQGIGGADSEDCDGASASGVEVFDGKTTEIHLISQCGNDPIGGLDVIASLNHAPEIDLLEFQPSKFTKACVPTTVCVTASDPDSDPLEIEWNLIDGDDTVESFTVTSTDNSGNSITECAQVEADTATSLQYEVTVYDLLHDSNTGNLKRFETYWDENGYPNRTSSDSLEFPIHIGENAQQTCDLDGGEQNNNTNNAVLPGTNNATNNGTNNGTSGTNNGTSGTNNGTTNGDVCTDTCQMTKTRQGPAYATITVTFECDEVHVTSSKDLSNVVLLFANGKTQKFDGLSGQSGTFSGTGMYAGDEIVAVYVKSGAYLSNDGPGWGEEFQRSDCQN